MPEQKMASVVDGTGKSRQSVQASQPVWVERWRQSSSNAAGKRRRCGNDELDCVSRSNNMKDGSKHSRSVKESRVTETKTFEFVMKHGQITDDRQTSRRVFGHNIEQEKSIEWRGGTHLSLGIPAVNEASFGRCNSVGESTTESLPEWTKTRSSSTDRSIAVLKPFQVSSMESSAHMVPYYNLEKCEFDAAQKELNKGKAPLIRKPPIVSKGQFPNSNMRVLKQEHHYNYKHGQPADLFCERKDGSHSDTAMDVCFREIHTSVLFDTPSSSHHHLPRLGQASIQKMQNHSNCEMLPRQGILAEKTASKNSCCNSCSLQKLPYCVHDMKTMRIFPTVDSVEATPEGSIADINGKTSNDRTPSLFSDQGKREGGELQSLGGSSNSKGKRNIGDVTASKAMTKHESSAETDIMDMDLFKDENSNPGTNHTLSIEGFNIDWALSPNADATSCREAGHHGMKTIPPNINVELPALQAAASSSEYLRPTSPRTQSLDIDMDMPPLYPNKKSSVPLGDFSKADPTMRWVKRLKLRSPNSYSQGMKSSNLGKNSPPAEMKIHFGRILESGIASSDPTPSSHHAKETVTSDKSQEFSKVSDDLMADSAKEGKESILSEAWIKRWLRNRSKVTKKNAATVVCEPHSFKLAFNDFQKEQFPSIAAMALMGRAMNGLQSCELQKQESFTSWNTKAFLKEI